MSIMAVHVFHDVKWVKEHAMFMETGYNHIRLTTTRLHTVLILTDRAVATLRHEEATASSFYDRWKNGIMMHELMFNELVVESQYLLKLRSGKITKNTPSCHSYMPSSDVMLLLDVFWKP